MKYNWCSLSVTEVILIKKWTFRILVKNLVILVSKRSPVTGLEGPRWSLEVKIPRFRDNGTGWW